MDQAGRVRALNMGKRLGWFEPGLPESTISFGGDCVERRVIDLVALERALFAPGTTPGYTPFAHITDLPGVRVIRYDTERVLWFKLGRFELYRQQVRLYFSPRVELCQADLMIVDRQQLLWAIRLVT